MNFKHIFDMCKKAVMAWVDDFAPSMGAAISYYTVFSLAPLFFAILPLLIACACSFIVRGYGMSIANAMNSRGSCAVCVWAWVAFHSNSVAGIDDWNVALKDLT